jgi:hypothetical protein
MKALAALAVKLTIGMQKLTPIQRFVLVERFRDELLEELERTCAAHDEPEYELVVEEIGKDEITLVWQVTRRRRVQADIRFNARMRQVGCVVCDPARSGSLEARRGKSFEHVIAAADWVRGIAISSRPPR